MIKKSEVHVVDVRAAEDYAEGHITGAVNLPKDRWETLIGLRKDKLNVLYCYSHVRAARGGAAPEEDHQTTEARACEALLWRTA